MTVTTAASISARRRLVGVLALSNTVAYIAMVQIVPVLLIPVADDLHTSRAAVAGAATVSILMGAVAAFPIGRILDRRGGRAVMTSGSAIGALAVLLWSRADSLPVLYAAFVLIGLSLAMSTYEASFAVLVVGVPSRDRTQAILALTMIVGLVTYLVYPILGAMNSAFGWRTTLVALAVLFAATAIPGHIWAVPTRAVHRDTVQTRSGVSFKAAMRENRFWLLLTSFVAQAGSASAFLILIIAYLLDQGHSMAVATSAPIAVGVLQIVARFALVLLGGRVSMTTVAASSFAVQAAGLLLLPLVGLSIPLTVLCVAAVGLGQGVAVIARPSILADTFGVKNFASVLAAITVPVALARGGVPLLGAWLADWRFLVVCGVLAMVGALALLPLLCRTTNDGIAPPAYASHPL